MWFVQIEGKYQVKSVCVCGSNCISDYNEKGHIASSSKSGKSSKLKKSHFDEKWFLISFMSQLVSSVLFFLQCIWIIWICPSNHLTEECNFCQFFRGTFQFTALTAIGTGWGREGERWSWWWWWRRREKINSRAAATGQVKGKYSIEYGLNNMEWVSICIPVGYNSCYIRRNKRQNCLDIPKAVWWWQLGQFCPLSSHPSERNYKEETKTCY